MKIVFSADEKNELTMQIIEYLGTFGEVTIIDDNGKFPAWPEAGYKSARVVADGKADIGVVMCYTGTGVTIAANKVRGIRCALCKNAEMSKDARLWNDANMLSLGIIGLSIDEAKSIIDSFINTTHVDESERKNILKLAEFESL